MPADLRESNQLFTPTVMFGQLPALGINHRAYHHGRSFGDMAVVIRTTRLWRECNSFQV